MWISLQASGAPTTVDLASLVRRADTQLRQVAALHRQAATAAFGGGTIVPVGAVPPEGHPDADTGPTEAPSDNTTLTSVVDRFAEEGYSGDFWAEADAAVRCEACDVVHPAGALDVHSQRRLEGASDPADMAVVVAARCPACGAKGTLVLMYGPAADPVDSDVLAALASQGGDAATSPPSSA
jgi:ferredoxin